MRESDLLAFEIGVGIADPGAVMCSYNAVNGDFACENKYLLTDVLKKEWAFKGFVVSDWGGTHSTVKASAAGLDNEEPLDEFFGAKLKDAVEAGKVSQAELDEHVRRILRSEFATGIVDYPTQKSVVDVLGGFETARKIEESSAVLLKNEKDILPLKASSLKSIAIIGASDQPNKVGGRPIAYLQRFGFAGRIYPINPNRESVQGLRTYRDLSALPEAPDLAIIATPAPPSVRFRITRSDPGATPQTAGFTRCDHSADNQSVQGGPLPGG